MAGPRGLGPGGHRRVRRRVPGRTIPGLKALARSRRISPGLSVAAPRSSRRAARGGQCPYRLTYARARNLVADRGIGASVAEIVIDPEDPEAARRTEQASLRALIGFSDPLPGEEPKATRTSGRPGPVRPQGAAGGRRHRGESWRPSSASACPPRARSPPTWSSSHCSSAFRAPWPAPFTWCTRPRGRRLNCAAGGGQGLARLVAYRRRYVVPRA